MVYIPLDSPPNSAEAGCVCIVLHTLNNNSADRDSFKHRGYGIPTSQRQVAMEILDRLDLSTSEEDLLNLCNWMRRRKTAKPAVFRKIAKDVVHANFCPICGTVAKTCQLPSWFRTQGIGKHAREGLCVRHFVLSLIDIGYYQFDRPTDWPLIDHYMALQGIGAWSGARLQRGQYKQRTLDERYPTSADLRKLAREQDLIGHADEPLEFYSPET